MSLALAGLSGDYLIIYINKTLLKKKLLNVFINV